MAFICVVLNVYSAKGQQNPHWTKLQSPASTVASALGPFDPTPYFLNSAVGFAYCSNINLGSLQIDSATHLNRSMDSGKTWALIPYFDTIHCAIRQIYFVSMSHGYLAGSLGVFETFDTGTTWKKISSIDGYYTSVYVIGSIVFAAIDYHWNRFSLGGQIGPLMCTSDDGTTWTTAVSPGAYGLDVQAAMQPFVFGNKENLVCFATFDQHYDYRLSYSTDSGHTWLSNLLDAYPRGGNASINATKGLYCLPHCSTIFRAHETGLGSSMDNDSYDIEKTTDYGLTWEFVLNRESGAWLVGNACAMYLSDAQLDSPHHVPSGPIRSTDVGSTWKHVDGGPHFDEIDDEDHFNLSIVGGGAVLYAGDILGDLWKTTDGGDGLLSASAFASHLWMGHSLRSTNPDTLLNGPCDSSSLEIYFENTSCNYLALQNFTVEGIDSTQYTASWKHHVACDALADTLSIHIKPFTVSALRDIRVVMSYMNDEFETLDTSVTAPLAPAPKHPTVLYLSALDSIRTVKGCEVGHSTATLNVSFDCQSEFTLNSIKLEGDTNIFSLLSLPAIPKSYRGGGFIDSFYVQFHPLNHAGSFTVRLHLGGLVHTPDTSYMFDTIVTIVASSTSVPPSALSFDSILHCDDVRTCSNGIDTSFKFFNSGCSPDTITSLSVVGAWFSAGIVSMPIVISPGDPLLLRILFMPPSVGTYSGTLDLHVTSMGLAQDARIGISGTAIPGPGILDMRSPSIQAGNFSICFGDTSITTHIGNKGCDTLIISSIHLIGDSDFVLTLSPIDSLIAPDSSLALSVYFKPLFKGNRVVIIRFRVRSLHESDLGYDTTISIAGYGTDGIRYLTQSVQSLDLGGVHVCQRRDTSFWLRNTGCDTLTIDSVEISGAGSLPNVTFPARIPQGDSILIRVQLSPDTTGHPSVTTCGYRFYSNSDTGRVIVVPVTAHVIYAAPLELTLSAGPFDSVMTFDILLKGEHSDVSSIAFDLSENEDVLNFENASGAGVSWTRSGPTRITISPVPPSDVIGTMTYRVYLSDSVSTPISISNASFTNALGLPNECIASLAVSNPVFYYRYSCGDDLMKQVMQTGTALIENIIPNPASHAIQLSLNHIDAEVGYAIVDAVGSSRVRGTTRNTTTVIDVSDLPEGFYYVFVNMRAGLPAIRPFAIVR